MSHALLLDLALFHPCSRWNTSRTKPSRDSTYSTTACNDATNHSNLNKLNGLCRTSVIINSIKGSGDKQGGATGPDWSKPQQPGPVSTTTARLCTCTDPSDTSATTGAGVPGEFSAAAIGTSPPGGPCSTTTSSSSRLSSSGAALSDITLTTTTQTIKARPEATAAIAVQAGPPQAGILQQVSVQPSPPQAGPGPAPVPPSTSRSTITVDSLLNGTDLTGTTPLGLACSQGLVAAAQQLLAAPGLHANARDANGRTALHLACRYGHVGVVAVLLGVPGIEVNANCLESGAHSQQCDTQQLVSAVVIVAPHLLLEVPAGPSVSMPVQQPVVSMGLWAPVPAPPAAGGSAVAAEMASPHCMRQATRGMPMWLPCSCTTPAPCPTPQPARA